VRKLLSKHREPDTAEPDTTPETAGSHTGVPLTSFTSGIVLLCFFGKRLGRGVVRPFSGDGTSFGEFAPSSAVLNPSRMMCDHATIRQSPRNGPCLYQDR
jgi:hypothetical protein